MLSGAEQYFSRNPTELRILTSSCLFPLGYQQRGPFHFRTIQTIDYYFRFFGELTFCGRQLGDYYLNQVTSTKILVAMEPKVVTAWRIAASSQHLELSC